MFPTPIERAPHTTRFTYRTALYVSLAIWLLPMAGVALTSIGTLAVVPADDVARLRSAGLEEIALQACHPRFFATQRYLVYAKPVHVTPRGSGHATSFQALGG